MFDKLPPEIAKLQSASFTEVPYTSAIVYSQKGLLFGFDEMGEAIPLDPNLFNSEKFLHYGIKKKDDSLFDPINNVSTSQNEVFLPNPSSNKFVVNYTFTEVIEANSRAEAMQIMESRLPMSEPAINIKII